MAPPYIVCMALTVFVMCADECLAWNGVEIPDERHPMYAVRVKRQALDGATSSCEDSHENCRRWAGRDYCKHEDYKRFMTIKCRRSCELCDGETKLITCDDKKDNCVFWAEQGHCDAKLYRKFMEINCRKSCDLCPEITSATKTTRKVTSSAAPTKSSTMTSMTSTTTSVRSTTTLTSTTTPTTTVTSATTPMTTVTSATTPTTAVTSATTPTTVMSTTTPTTTVTSTTSPITTVTSTTPPTTTVTSATIPTTTVTSTTTPTTTVTSTTTPTTVTLTTTPTTNVTSATTPTTTVTSTTTPTTATLTTTPTTTVTSTTTPTTTVTSATTTPTTVTSKPTPTTTVTATTTPTIVTSTATPTTSITSTTTPTTTVTSTTTPTTTVTSATTPTTTVTSATTPTTTMTSTTTPTSTVTSKTTPNTTVTSTATPTSSLRSKTSFVTSSTSTMPSTPTWSSTPPPTTTSCQDLSTACPFLAYFCNRSVFAQNNCPVTCGLCSVDGENSTFSMEMTKLNFFQDVATMEPTRIAADITIDTDNFGSTVEVTSSTTTPFALNMTSHDSGVKDDVAMTITLPSAAIRNWNDSKTNALTGNPFTSMTLLPFRTSTQIAPLPFRTTTPFAPPSTGEDEMWSDCVDKFEECVNIYMFCDVNVNVRDNCKKTCGLCNDVTVTMTTVSAEMKLHDAEEDCEDTFSKCVELISECRRAESMSFLQRTCKKTCGFCADPTSNGSLPTTSTDCVDKQEVCELWAQSGFCDSAIYPQLKEFMEMNCRRSCKLCGGNLWSAWTPCSLSCGGGKQTRTKITCQNGSCSDPEIESRFCSLEVCPDNPDACEDRISELSCQQYKERNACKTEVISALCGATCGSCKNGSSAMTSQEWQLWGPWSFCNASCNGGFQTRNRTCPSASCDGPSEENVVCNSFRCHTCYDQSSNCRTMEELGACRKVVWKLYCKVTCGICRPSPIQGRCADSNPNCPAMRGRCFTPSVAHACPVTCGRCVGLIEPPTTTLTSLTQPTVQGLPKLCVDQHAGCPKAAEEGYCSDQKIVEVCPGSCKKCRKKMGSESSDATKCVDTWEFCPTLEAGCGNSSFVQENCRATCKQCGNVDKQTDGCVDQSLVCAALARYGQCGNPTIATGCRLSCDASCSPTSAPVATATTPSSATTPSCVDGHSTCSEYRALGRCGNEFIRFLCPLSCQACGEDREPVVPECKDNLGTLCSVFATQCSNALVRYGCEKTCGGCAVGPARCEDTLEKECQALGREGMCAMASFRLRCPVTCNACKVDDVADEEKLSSSCADEHANCVTFAAFCAVDPAIKSICRKTCNACSGVVTPSGDPGTRCIDINPGRCSRLSTLGQCSSNPTVAFMCASSCGKCVSVNCVNRHPTCDNESVKKYCVLRSIQLQCPRTCGTCDKGDQEGTTTETVMSSKSSQICRNYIDDCRTYKRHCGMDGWLHYMDYMCPKSCGACGQGTWSKWSSWSQCSKSCNDDPGPLHADSGGNRTRTRQCIEGAYCPGGKDASVEIGKCNKDKCPSLVAADACVDQPSCKQWTSEGRCRVRRYRAQMKAACPVSCGYCTPKSTWSSWTKCDAVCGEGQRSRTMECPSSKCKQTKGVNTTEIETCMIKPCDGWSSWSGWSRCSATCGIASRLRIRVCMDGPVGGVMCPGSYLYEDVCSDNSPCAVWATWSSWSSCSLTCGYGSKLRNRTCLNSSETMTCDGSKVESDSCNEWSCFEWMEWGSWSICSIPCGGDGKQVRYRKCPDVRGSCGKNSAASEEQSCGTQECSTWTPWSNWTECSVTCGGGGTQRRIRACLGSELCIGDKVENIECMSKNVCIRWSDWSEFSECSATCGKGYATRTRTCNPTRMDSTVRDDECPGLSSEKVTCNCDVCPDVGAWSPWGKYSDCPVSCDGAKHTRRRLCLNGIPGRGGCQGPSHNTVRCNQDPCPIGKWDNWGEWSSCSASCGDGLRTRDRICFGGKVGAGGCPGNEENVERCNTHACPQWSKWGAWGTCSASCGTSGTRTRIRSCYDEHIDEIVFEENCPSNNVTSQNEACNLHDCPNWAPWEPWTDCSASCGVGFTQRQRGCQNGLVGAEGCHDGHNSEKSLCNEWDCPSSCRSVALKSGWKSSDSDDVMMAQSSDSNDTIAEPSNDLSWLVDHSRASNQSLRCLTVDNTDRWVQISFHRSRSVSGISMRGYQNVGARKYSWVKKFLVLYGDDLNTLEPVLDNAGRPRLFNGPSGPIETVHRYWQPVKARHWRVKILASQPTRWVCMESSLYRCKIDSDLDRGQQSEGVFEEGSGRF